MDNSNPDHSSPESEHDSSSMTESAAAVAAAEDNFRSLRNMINLVLLGLIILAGSVGYLMLHEIQVAARQIRQTAGPIVAFERDVAPKLKDFGSKLEAYSKLHSDYLPIYNKYFGTNAQAAAPAPVADAPVVQP